MGTVTPATSGPVTVCVTQRILPGRESEFEAWLRGISRDAEQFLGHQGINVLRPEGSTREYTYIFRFDSYKHLRTWEDSDDKQQWLAKLSRLTEAPAKKQILTGLEYWFTLASDPAQLAPPRYKMACITVFAIYPLTTLLGQLLAHPLGSMTFWVRGLPISILAVVLMTYAIMPRLTRLFARWLFQ